MKKIMCALLVCVLAVGFLPVIAQAAEHLVVHVDLQTVSGMNRNVEIGIYYRDIREDVFQDEMTPSVFTQNGIAMFFVNRTTADIDDLHLVILSGEAAGISIPFNDLRDEGNGNLRLSVFVPDLISAQPVVESITPPTAVAEPTTPVITGTRTLRFVIGNVNFTDNGAGQVLEAPPFIADGRTHVPLRVIVEAFGSDDVAFSDGIITFSVDSQAFTMTVGQELPGGMGTPVIHAGRTFVPLRFIVESLGADIRWDGDNQAAYIYIN